MKDPISMLKNQAKRATVTIVGGLEADTHGCGFFVRGGYILTATCCLLPGDRGRGRTHPDDCFLVKIIAADGSETVGQVVAVDLISGISAIGRPDCEINEGSAAAEYQEFVESIEGLSLHTGENPPYEYFSVRVLTPGGKWLLGKAMQGNANSPTLHVVTELAVPEGMAGSAIFNDSGEVVGVVLALLTPTPDSASAGACPRPCQSLPVWLWRIMEIVKSKQE